MIRKVEMERFTVISARRFDEVVAAIKTSIGNPNMAEFWKSTQEAKSAAELGAVEHSTGPGVDAKRPRRVRGVAGTRVPGQRVPGLHGGTEIATLAGELVDAG